MMKSIVRAGFVAALMASTGVVGTASAAGDSGPFSQRVRNSCKGDYNRFCPGYSLYSNELRRCMQSAGRSISKGCQRALVHAGEVPRSMLSGK